MTRTRLYLLGVLTGVLLSVGAYTVRAEFTALDARITRIEQYLMAMTRSACSIAINSTALVR